VLDSRRIDDLDRDIIERLRQSPEATNRSLAKALGVTEQTIAARIRRLDEANLLRVLAVLDVRTVGYRLFAIVGIQVSGRAPSDVAEEVAALPCVTGITSCLGGFELVATFYARDQADLSEQLEKRLGAIPGVEDMESFLVLKRVRHRIDWATLDRLAPRKLAPEANVEMDDLDRQILELLQANARTSFREIGRRLSCSEGTVRLRARHLEESGLFRIQALTDVSIGPGSNAAWIAIKARRGSTRHVAEAIGRLPEAGFVGITLGRFDVIALMSTPSREEFSRLVFSKVALLPGVQRLEAWEALRSFKHDFRIADLSPTSIDAIPPKAKGAQRGRSAPRRGRPTRSPDSAA
jgi:DNA-binding Lrp family transcriptional regulator